MDGVGPGSYGSPEAFDKTQKPREYMISKATSKRTGFTEGFSQLTAKNPALGQYKDVDRGLKMINKPTFDVIK